ncbi:MAG: acyl-CoA thioesterase [Treponema sp.]|jgi:acyl-CoA thioester hydrolase|nr:acyl-CoA thioesterase [Treponema sp.]
MFITTVTPRFGDMDFLGHINNTVPAVWFELARNPLWRIFVPDFSRSHQYWPLIMAHTDYDFIEQLYFNDDVEIRSWITCIGVKSFTVHQEARQKGRLCVKGNAVIVHYDFKNKQSTPLPEDKKKLLAEHMKPK